MNKISMEEFITIAEKNLKTPDKISCISVDCSECPIYNKNISCDETYTINKIKEYKNIQANIKLIEKL